MPEKRIGSRTYRVEKLPATEATRMLIKLTKVVGPALPKLSAAIAGGKEGKTDDSAALAAIADLLMSSDADDLTNFVIQIAEHAEVQVEKGGSYDPVVYDLIPDLIEGFQVVAFVLQVQFRDFFGGRLGSVLQSAKPAETAH